jgi:hypothetical protein
MDAAFEHYREKEDAWWKSHNVERPREYLVRPSGRLDAPERPERYMQCVPARYLVEK